MTAKTTDELNVTRNDAGQKDVSPSTDAVDADRNYREEPDLPPHPSYHQPQHAAAPPLRSSPDRWRPSISCLRTTHARTKLAAVNPEIHRITVIWAATSDGAIVPSASCLGNTAIKCNMVCVRASRPGIRAGTILRIRNDLPIRAEIQATKQRF